MSHRYVVGIRRDRPPTEYYLGYESTGAGATEDRFRSVRAMLGDHLADLERQCESLQKILASNDPEDAERYLQDGLRMQISEVVLRPHAEVADIALRTIDRTSGP